MGHYMTKEGVSITCKNCLYWGSTKSFYGGRLRSCGNANQKQRLQMYFNKCGHFWPKHEHRK